jgi:acetyl esterase
MKPVSGAEADSLPGSKNIADHGRNGDYPRLSHADRGYLEKINEEPLIGALSLEQERERMRNGQTADLDNFAVRIETYQTASCLVHILRPLEIVSSLPVTFYFHGGGWTLGDLKTHAKLVCELAIRSRSAVVFLEYPLAPEHVFPAPLEACISAISEILQIAPSISLDRNRCGFVGDSSGGNLCLAYSVLAKERNLFVPQTQVLLYPVADGSLSLPSHLHFAHNPNLGRQTMEWFWSNYLSDASERETASISPLNASEDVLSAFPPTLIVSCEYDILRDEAEQLATRLVNAGIEVIAVRWLGVLHGFVVNEALSGSATAQACVNFIGHHLAAAYDRVR